MRLYSFVAGLYLSELQKGLQTGHTVSEFAAVYGRDSAQMDQVYDWSKHHKTIIILNAHTHGGVLRAHSALQSHAAEIGLPIVVFREDEESMNCMATAAAVVVPRQYYEVKKSYTQIAISNSDPMDTSHLSPDFNWEFTDYDIEGKVISCTTYWHGTKEHAFVSMLKSHSLA